MYKKHGRHTPYTQVGIERLPCIRCGKPSMYQWQICSDGRLYRPICSSCDVELNETVLKFMNFTAVEVADKMAAYKLSVGL